MKMSSKFEISKELNDSIRQILGRNVRISFKCTVRMEIKGDKIDNKILAFSACRLFVMSTKIPSKVDFHFHYLEIRSLESKNSHHLCIEAGEKYYTFYTQDSLPDLVDQIVLQLNVSIKTIFPSVSLQHVIKKIDFVPPSRFQTLTEHAKFQENKECGPCGGFSAQYAWMCDFHGLPYREEVAWDVDTIYLSQDTRELCLQDFDHLEPRDLIPIISALIYNRWFTKLKSSNIRQTSEAAEQIIRVLRKSVSIEEIYLDNMGLRWDYVQKLSQALVQNTNSSVHTLDFSNNFIEDKGILHLVNALIKLPKGLIHLNLAKTGLTAKGVNTLANGLSVNKFMSSSLTYLNLADNTLKDDVTNLYNFLAQPNTVSHLDLSGTDIALDMLFGALLRGCTQKLSHLNLSRNTFSHKKSRDIVPTSFKQFFTSTIGLKYLNLSATRLPTDALKNILLGLAFNVTVKDVELDLSCNNLGQQGAHVLDLCIVDVHSLVSLDISDNGIETELASVITAIGKNKSLKRLAIGRNFNNIKSKYMKNVIEAFVQIIQDDDCVIEHLSLADSKLKSDIYCIINALGSNQCLMSVDISGNQMGDAGARLLAKALQINTRLKALFYDRNNITAAGFCDLAYALQSNYTVRYMPYPIFDVCMAMKTNPEKTDAAMKRIENLLHRNVSPKKFSHSQAFRLQQGFLLSSTQQMVDRLVVQTQDTIKTLKQTQIGESAELVLESEAYIQDADKSKQLLTRLHDVILQREETGNPVEQKLNQMSEELQHVVQSYLEDSVDSMLKCAEDQCSKILHDSKLLQDLKATSRFKSKIPSTFVQQTVVEQAGTDVLNKINELNLAVASHISDRIVDEVIESLSKNQKALMTFANNMQNSTPDVLLRRTRLGSDLGNNECSDKDDIMQDTPELSSKRKSVQTRKLRPQSVVDIPEDLIVDGPPDLLLTEIKTIHSSSEDVFPQRLQHLGKARPKRQKTKAPTRPNLRTDTIIEDEQNLNEGLDVFFQKSESSPTLSSLTEVKSRKSISKEKSKDKHEAKKVKEKSSDSDKDKKEKSGRLVQGLSNMFSRRTSDRSSKSKNSENPSDKNKSDAEPLSSSFLSNKEVETNKNDSQAVDLAFCQPSAIPRVGVGGNVLAEMKARQEKRLSLHKDQLDVLEKENRLSFSPKLSPSLTKLAQNDSCTTNGISSRTSPSVDEKRLSETFAKKSDPLPILKTPPSSSSHAYSSTAGKSGDRGSSPKTVDIDSVSPINKRALSGKPKPPPIAPKPRPRSMISPDFRKSGEFSPGSDISSLDGSTGTTPERGDLQDDSIDSGLMGSRDSLSPRELTPDSSLSPDMETIKRKAASLPRTATPDMVTESPTRGRSYSYREILNSSLNDMSHGGHRPVSLPPESGILQIRNKNENKTLLTTDYHVDDIVNV